MFGDSRTLPGTARVRTSLFSLCLLGSVLHGQTPEQRRAIDAFRDTLQTLSDSVALQDREGRLLRSAERARNDALLHLQLGQLALRQAELGGRSHYDDAASEFTWAAELSPQWPYAWFGLGLAECSLGARLADNRDLTSSPGRAAWGRAVTAFGRAAVLEPGLAPRFEALARRALREHSREQAAVVRDALRAASGGLPRARGARLLLALGRVQREMGDSGALRSFQAYLASKEDRPLALLELGRIELLRGELSGMTDYLAGAAEEDPPSIAEYRTDLLPIAGEMELADFELRRGSARAETLRRFWSRRDRLELRQEGERLAEHLRRLLVAQRDFVVVNTDGGERLDDRGRIYVRHGEPDDRASFNVPGVEPNESWRYHRGGSDLVFHFVARQTLSDFRLVESVLDFSEVGTELVPAGPASADRGGSPSSADRLLRSRSALAPVYGQVRSARPEQRSRYLDAERAQGRHAIQIGTRSDSYPLRFERELDGWGIVLVAGGSGQAPALQVVFAIPGYTIAPATGVAGVVYPVRVRFAALDPEGAVVASVDSIVRIELSEPVPANRRLLGRLAVPVRPGRLLAHTIIQYGEHAGSSFAVDSVVVPAPGGDELALGDLLLGEPNGRLKVPYGAGEVALSPGGLVHRSAGAELGIEIYGLRPAERAELRVLVAPLDTVAASAEVPLRWRAFPDRQASTSIVRVAGSGPIVPWRTTLPLKKLKPGSWLLAVEVSTAGRTARREGRLVVATP